MRTFFTITAIIIFNGVLAQEETQDTVSIGVGYSDQVWYSLENDEQGTSSNNNWDIAFEIGGFSASILVNHPNDVHLWLYPSGDTTDWSTLDTSGMAANWKESYNSDTSWSYGAFNAGTQYSSNVDLGWGQYNTTTHKVVGDSLFVIKIGNGDYKKLWIEHLSNGKYTFRYANLDGTGDVTTSIEKSNYTDKNFGYYSIVNQQELDREPNNSSWDLIFTQYGVYFPNFNYFTNSTGVLQNYNIEASKAYPVDDSSTYEDFGQHTFQTEINTIGYSWKNFNTSTSSYDIEDSTVYFVQDQNDTYWKLVFTDFGGAGSGEYMFTKKKIGSVGIEENKASKSFSKIYPNPSAAGQNTSLVIDPKISEQCVLRIFNLSGKQISTQRLSLKKRLQTYSFQAPKSSGQYIVQISGKQTQITQKLIVR